MNPESRSGQPHPERIDAEITPEKEKRIPAKTVLVAGESWDGKGILTKGLKELNNWTVYSGKDDFMELERRNGPESTRWRNSFGVQRIFDRYQLNRILQLKPEDAVLYETRLAGIIYAEAQDIRAEQYLRRQKERQTQPNLPKIEMIPAVSLLLYARLDVRVDRAYNISLINWETAMQNPEARLSAPPKPTKAEIKAQLLENQQKDIRVWSRLRQHKNYIWEGGNPFDPNLRRPNGGLVYDWKIDTSDLTPEEIIEKFEMEADAWGIYLPKNSPKAENSSETTTEYNLYNGEPFSPRKPEK